MLAEIYNRFIEGFGDLNVAKALLNELSV
jgi:hypothetical protein